MIGFENDHLHRARVVLTVSGLIWPEFFCSYPLSLLTILAINADAAQPPSQTIVTLTMRGSEPGDVASVS